MLSPNFWGYPLDLVYGLVIIRSVNYNYIAYMSWDHHHHTSLGMGKKGLGLPTMHNKTAPDHSVGMVPMDIYLLYLGTSCGHYVCTILLIHILSEIYSYISIFNSLLFI